ncbi:NAD(P)/FAD-dependent oxidoreductase (plasmid) [Streptomyces sp. PCS3-D2]|uniref:NAD(P)/FAD-dependent oxidoreductase n=1 Tax=Streptomyces sp. PCS3-D2 TaxID=1460244 RepID=UPI00044FF32B|nr:NAD(P)/FAD-dependent oxidoreductase [Streptomyces sp. PCS3-D2]WKV76572.1 NAD(P)/FAD-dependent oxidoreductase [Streptomyces sp. PCS3-D2]
MNPTAQYDTVIIGGGPAGLTAALALTRYRHRTLVVESPAPPRNAASRGVHGLIGLEGATPGELRARAWEELDRYGLAQRLDATVSTITPSPGDGFTVRADDGTSAWARNVILATGVTDLHPDGVEGFAACWGRTVIHCPFCIGEENADRTWALVADEPGYLAMAATAFRAWTGDTVAIAPPSLPGAAELRRSLREQGSDLIQGEITRLHHTDGDLHAVELADGTLLERQTLLWPRPQRQVPLVERLAAQQGLALSDGYVTVDDGCQTSIPGLYAAGDLTAKTWEQGAVPAVAAGAAAADAIHFAHLA